MMVDVALLAAFVTVGDHRSEDCSTSRMRSPGCRRPSLTAAPRCRIFFTKIGPGPWTEESLVTTVKPRPSVPGGTEQTASQRVLETFMPRKRGFNNDFLI